MSDRLSRGKLGEDITADYLCKNDFEVVARNYHSRYGEIDIIAKNSDFIAFVEVKARNDLKDQLPQLLLQNAERLYRRH